MVNPITFRETTAIKPYAAKFSKTKIDALIPTVIMPVLVAQSVSALKFVDVKEVEVEGRNYYQIPHESMLAKYWYECLRFWSKMGRGIEPGPWVATKRKLVAHQQSAHADLKDVYAALNDVPIISGIVDVILNTVVSETELAHMAGDMSAVVHVVGDGATVYTFVCPRAGWSTWVELLGGALSPGEEAREIKVTVRYAKWRDRRVRRLVRVDVYTHELWPKKIILDA